MGGEGASRKERGEKYNSSHWRAANSFGDQTSEIEIPVKPPEAEGQREAIKPFSPTEDVDENIYHERSKYSSLSIGSKESRNNH